MKSQLDAMKNTDKRMHTTEIQTSLTEEEPTEVTNPTLDEKTQKANTYPQG